MNKLKFGNLVFVIYFVIGILSLEFTSFAEQKSYDGLWFMGFNLHKDLFGNENGTTVRKAFNLAINRQYIATQIIKDNITPNGVIPYGMNGYSASLKGFPLDPKYAKELLRAAGYSPNDPRLKNLTLLHTDGQKTIEIAKAVERNLKDMGIKITRTQMSYKEGKKWEAALKGGQFHLFLIGYKAGVIGDIFVGDQKTKVFHSVGCPQTPFSEDQVLFNSYAEAVEAGYAPCTECKPRKKEGPVDTFGLLQPLFHSEGSANFTFYRNARVDLLLDQIASNFSLSDEEKAEKYQEINEILQNDPPTVNLFYITKL